MLKNARAINGGTEGSESHPELNQVALRRVGQPEEVANLVAFLLSDESTYISGNDISIDGGWRC